MNPLPEKVPHLRGLRMARFEAFSDGVIAIATTLLVLELAVPVVTGDDLLRALAEEWPSCLATW